jgi:hypothetical protein
MDTDRRSVLKASGVAALLSTTGLAGCSGLLGGGGGTTNWQYDPGTLRETESKFFGAADLAGLYEARQQLPDDVTGGVENTENSPINPEDLERASGVGGLTIPMSSESSSEGFGSFAITGSFSASDITDEVEQSEDAQSAGEYEGYSLWENAGESVSAGGMTGDSSGVIGIRDGTMVVGAAGTNEGAASVTGEQAAKTMIDAGNGETELLANNNEFVQTLSDNLGSGTMQFGGTVDPALIEAFAGMGGSGSQFTNGFRAGGVDMAINGETTTITGVGVYEDAEAAEATGIKTIIDGFSEELTNQEGFNSVEAEYSGSAVVMTIEGDTQTLFEQGAGQAPVNPGGGV